MNDIPLVSVIITAYNQEKYIAQAIDSVLAQQVNFIFEIVIGEDASTDNTKRILSDYSISYPDIIKVIYNPLNLGIVGNWTNTINKSNGKYIALCEGDDYWVGMDVLQKKIDFLENNPDFSMVCTDYEKYFESTGVRMTNCFRFKKYRDEVRFYDYIHDRSTIMSATVVFTRSIFDYYQKSINEELRLEWKMPDTPLWLFISWNSKIFVMQDSTAVYRMHEISGSNIPDKYTHFRYVEKGFDIPVYFAEQIAKDVDLLNVIQQNRLNFVLEFAFLMNNKPLFNELCKQYIRENNSISFRIYLLKAGMKGFLNHRLLKELILFWRKYF